MAKKKGASKKGNSKASAKAAKKSSNKGSNKPSKKGTNSKGKRPVKKDADKDVKMADAKEVTKEDTSIEVEEIKEEPIDAKKSTRSEIKSAVLLTLHAVTSKDHRLFSRVVRHMNAIRKKQTPGLLASLIDKYYPEMKSQLDEYSAEITAEHKADAELAVKVEVWTKQEKVRTAKAKKEEELKKEKESKDKKDKKGKKDKKEAELDPEKIKKAEKAAKDKEAKEVEKQKQKALDEAKKEIEATKLSEVKAMVHFLICAFLVDQNKTDQAATCAKALVDYVQPLNRRSMDHFSAKAFYLYCLTHERLGQLDVIRGPMVLYHRTAVLQHNEPGQAMLVVCILRSFLAYKLFTQADNFRLKTTLPESKENDVYARYLYYTAQINAVQLQYSDAFQHLTQSLRKAPQHYALGFRQTVTKLLVIVQLLMGEIPERSTFSAADIRRSLVPYFELTQTVRVGDIAAFAKVAELHQQVWKQDGLSSLIARLRNNVIKTGLRKINVSYSRISLEDVQTKLNLDSVEDAEFIVSKCIHDGVIDAVIDREKRYMFSKERGERYATHEPQAVFHKRVLFCMDIHNGAVKALRFPPNAIKKDDDDTLRDDDEVELEADSMDDD